MLAPLQGRIVVDLLATHESHIWLIAASTCVVTNVPMRTNNISNDTCALCRRSDDLRQSHIVPEFVWRWLKETGGGGYLRFVFNPNKREQDGFQERILCGDCEGLFSSWEKEFSERVFVPMHRDGVSVVQYGPWLGKLCVSVCWRTLFVFHQMGSLHHFSDDLRTSAESALTAWRDYLLDQAKTPAPFDIHLLPLEPIQSTSVTDMPPNMNRYLLRAVDLEVVCSARSAFVYCKLCQTALFGFIKMPEASAWIGTGISYGEDTIAPRNYHVPGELLPFLIGRAKLIVNSYSSMSQRQKMKIQEYISSNPDRVAESENLKAFEHDLRLFGSDAFFRD